MIEIAELTAGYGSKAIISRFSFSCHGQQGPIVLVGPNGSGKSTLLKAILGEIPFSGQIKLPEKEKGIGWLPQHYKVGLRMPVLDFIRLGGTRPGKWFPSTVSGLNEKVEWAISQLEIAHLANKFTDELSGGEWQLVCLAQLWVQPTDIWLLDEPTASLDIYYKSLVLNFLWEMAAKGKTIFLATHDLPFLPSYQGILLPFPGPEMPQNLTPENLTALMKVMRKSG